MNTMPAVRADLTNAQETIQTLLLIIVSFVAAWLSVYRVPWQVSGDPCLLAAAATVVIVTCLWLTRWRGLPGLNSERNLLAGFLVGMPLIYVSRYLFASTGRIANYWFWVEVLGTAIFVALAVLGLTILLAVAGGRTPESAAVRSDAGPSEGRRQHRAANHRRASAPVP